MRKFLKKGVLRQNCVSNYTVCNILHWRKVIFLRSNWELYTLPNFLHSHQLWWLWQITSRCAIHIMLVGGKYTYVNNKHLYMIQSSEAHCRHQMNDYGKFCAGHEFESKSRWMAVLWSHQSDTWFTYQWPCCWPGVPNWWTQHPHQHCCGMQIEVTTTTQHSDSGCHIYGGLPTYTWSHHSLGSLVWMF